MPFAEFFAVLFLARRSRRQRCRFGHLVLLALLCCTECSTLLLLRNVLHASAFRLSCACPSILS